MKTIVGHDIEETASWLKQNEPVAIPTETVYGLAANATSEEAIRKVFTVKGRPQQNPLIVHLAGTDRLYDYVTDLPQAARLLMDHFMPGPLTLLLRHNGSLPRIINHGLPEMAFRVPAHPYTHDLLVQLPFPLVAPSANKYMSVSPTEVQHVLKNFDGAIPYILDGGPCDYGLESTIVGFSEAGVPIIYRYGAIPVVKIERLAGSVIIHDPQTDHKPAPGMEKRHYAPATPLRIVANVRQLPDGIDLAHTGILSLNTLHHGIPPEHQFLLSVEQNMDEAAHNLYKALHDLDKLGLNIIFAEKLPNIGQGIAINDRLQRAAARTKKPPFK